MKTIWKFPLLLTARQTLQMPTGAKILTAQIQGSGEYSKMTLWAQVDPDVPKVNRQIAIAGTGHDLPSGEYVGTIQQHDFVWHVYDQGDQSWAREDFNRETKQT